MRHRSVKTGSGLGPTRAAAFALISMSRAKNGVSSRLCVSVFVVNCAITALMSEMPARRSISRNDGVDWTMTRFDSSHVASSTGAIVSSQVIASRVAPASVKESEMEFTRTWYGSAMSST